MPSRPRRKPTPSVGRNVPRTEGRDKVTGRARYIDDLTFPAMIYGRTVRSSIAHGRILSVTLDREFDWTGFTVVDHRDVPEGGRNLIAMIVEDQPCLAADRVRHREEAIVLLAHADRGRLEEGLAHVFISYAAENAVLDFLRSEELQKRLTIEKGDLEAGFAAADRIIEGTYSTGHQEQLYIETNGVIALPGDGGAITVHGSMQCPHYVARALRVLLGLPEEKVRVVQATTGGGFGGKEEYPSVIAGHAALLARKAGRPVKMIYDRLEDMVATTKRHPAHIHHRTGVKRDGTLTAIDIDLRIDGGAYVTLTPVVLSRAAIHATGPYRCPNVRILGRAFATNTPPNGAFRGFGAPQSQFAAELHMNRIADALELDPVMLRRKNLLRAGDTTATGQLLQESVSGEEVLDRALALHERVVRRNKSALQRSMKRGMRCGTGLALFFHGSGFTGGGELKLASRAGLELTADGVRIIVGSTEIGQGTRTMLAQIVADTLALPYEWIATSDPDTARVPDSGPTVASRTCMIVGGILQRAAGALAAAVGPWRSPKEFRRRARNLLGDRPSLAFMAEYERPGEIVWSDETYRGDAYGAYAWGCNIADVEVDPITYEARCTHLTAVIDIGRAIHPLLVEGQIEGGSAQAVGWALQEEVVMRDGRMANGQLTNYLIPTTLDTPAMAVEIVENPYSNGPFGAKGVGECPIDGPAPAVVAAIHDAIGVRLSAIPATPERIMEALDAASVETVVARAEAR